MHESSVIGLEISVVVPTFNRRRQLARLMDGLLRQSCPANSFEVIVVNDGSEDDTVQYLDLLKTPFCLRVISQPNQGVATARNQGVADARANWILFLDDDVSPVPELIQRHLEILCQDEQRVVLGPMLTPLDIQLEPWVLWEQRMLEKQYNSMLRGKWEPTARQFYTGNTSLARRHILAAGGFDPAFRRAEDVELAYRLQAQGLQFYFAPQAQVYHYAERSYQSWLKIAYHYGKNDVIMTRTKGQAWLLPTVMKEYKLRNAGVRTLTRLCLGKPAISRMAMGILKKAAWLGSRLGVETVPRYAYSGIFNLSYYQGMADELGGESQFWQLLETAQENPLE
jgi:GT2 family glycosyltransferase